MPSFQERKFQNPAIRLLRTSVKLKGSYTFEVFAYENRQLYQFNVRFLPYSSYYLSRFVTSLNDLNLEDADVQKVSELCTDIFLRFRDQWEGKKSIDELTLGFLNLLINNHKVEIPQEVLTKIQDEIKRIFNRPDICRNDTKGRPFFSNAAFGKFFIDEIGILLPEDYARYNIRTK